MEPPCQEASGNEYRVIEKIDAGRWNRHPSGLKQQRGEQKNHCSRDEYGFECPFSPELHENDLLLSSSTSRAHDEWQSRFATSLNLPQ